MNTVHFATGTAAKTGVFVQALDRLLSIFLKKGGRGGQMGGQFSLWNSLEVVKLIISALTPIIVILIGFWIHKLLKDIESRQWVNQTVIQWKVNIYDELSLLLNDLYCYFLYIGNWKELSPVDIIKTKRILDKKINIAFPLFSDKFLTHYNAFINSCFKTFSGKGKDAQLKTGFESRKQVFISDWKTSWEELFVEESEKTSRDTIDEKYRQLMKIFAQELNLALNIQRTGLRKDGYE